VSRPRNRTPCLPHCEVAVDEGVVAGGQEVQAAVEGVVVDGDDEIAEVAFGVGCHVVGETVTVHWQWAKAQLVGEVALRVARDGKLLQCESREVLDVEGVVFRFGFVVVGLARADGFGQGLGDAYGVQGIRVLASPAPASCHTRWTSCSRR